MFQVNNVEQQQQQQQQQPPHPQLPELPQGENVHGMCCYFVLLPVNKVMWLTSNFFAWTQLCTYACVHMHAQVSVNGVYRTCVFVCLGGYLYV